MSTATDSRDAIKVDLVQYLTSVAGVSDREILKKAVAAVRDAAWQSVSVDKDIQRECRDYLAQVGMGIGDDFYYRLSWNFSPRHYKKLIGFIQRLEAVEDAECRAEAEIERKIEAEIDSYRDPLVDEYYDDMGGPDFAICVYPDKIEVRAYQKGVGEVLPRKGRKYVGCAADVRWQYPLSSLADLKALGRPVVNVADFQK